MPNKSIYVREEDLEIFEKVQKLGKESISSLLIEKLQERLSQEESQQVQKEKKARAQTWFEEFTKTTESGWSHVAHLEFFGNGNRVRYRSDEVLKDYPPPEDFFQEELVDFFRKKANLSSEKVPQSGRFSWQIKGKPWEVVVSYFPITQGDYFVLRLLKQEIRIPTLEKLASDQWSKLQHLAAQPYGLVLATGPTGSGKTTTLYSFLDQISSPNLMTYMVESPVELLIPDCVQIPVSTQPENNFASVLNLVRQADPDVVYVSEFPNLETARIAVEMALTGHLIFGCLHAPDSLSAVSRLQQIGIPSFILGKTLRGIIAQRLVRRLCSECKEKSETGDSSSSSPSSSSFYSFLPKKGQFYQSVLIFLFKPFLRANLPYPRIFSIHLCFYSSKKKVFDKFLGISPFLPALLP